MCTRRLFTALLVLVAMPLAIWAWDPPAYGDSTGFLTSPVFLGGPLSVASSESPMADLLNPAASGSAQRVTMDLSYLALVGTGDESGWGHALNAGLAIPRPYGVWSLYAGLLSSPFDAMPLGTAFTGRAGLAKDVYDDLSLGLAVDMTLGGNDGLAWGFGFDLGVLGRVGDVGFLKDLRWGAAVRNLGIAYDPPGDAGIKGSGNASGFDSPYTLALGAKASLLKPASPGFSLDGNLDLWFPSFQNAVLALGLELGFRDVVFLRTGWDFNLAEAIAGVDQGLIPSVGLGARFMINRQADDSYISRQGWDRSEIRPSVAASQLTGDVWAFGGGVNMPLGVLDKSPPVIKLGYPETSWGSAYISPNADGRLDDLTMPLSISDQRYVTSYALKVYDESGSLVRVIANKDARPESQGVKSFFSRLFYAKTGIPIPPELSWNGLTDSGAQAPDGRYVLVLEASDDNGNVGSTERYPVVIDTAAPELALTQAAGAESLIFSPDGDGNKDSFSFSQSGSAEDLWTIEVLDATGKAVRSWQLKDAPLSAQSWDGKDDAGAVVPDGVYSYRVSSEDRAGNRSSARMENILVNTQQPPVAVSIDLAAFSPNGDGVKDTLSLSPNVPVRTGLSSWSLAVVDEAGKDVWTSSGTGSEGLAAKIGWDGKGSSKTALPEGTYRTRLTVTYVNGHAPTAWSPSFVIDLSPPQAKAAADRAAFNPLADSSPKVTITQSGSEEDRWQGQILNAAGAVVKSWTFIGSPDATVSWDGSDDAGKTVPDGSYSYRLTATDPAGNAVTVSSSAILVDTEKKAVRLSTDKRAFSPNADRVNDELSLTPEVASASRVKSWTVSVANKAGDVVRSFKGSGAPPSRIGWDGKTDSGPLAPNGAYIAVLEVRYSTDEVESARTVEVLLDTLAPAIRLEAADTLFSPNGDGRKDSITIKQDSDAGDTWEGRIVDAAGKTVRAYTWKDKAADFAWDGSDAQGNRVPDGSYRYVVSSTDAAGNKTEKAVERIVVDTKPTQVFVTAAAAGFSPNGDKLADEMAIGIIVNNKDGLSGWKLDIVGPDGAVARTWSGAGAATIPARQVWDGRTDKGPAAQGSYTARLSVDYLKGDRAEAQSAAFALDTEGPRASLALSPKYFSPDNDGVDDELRIALAVADASALDSWTFEIFEVAVEEGSSGKKRERSFFLWSGKGKPSERLAWDGRSQRGELVESATDYPYRFTIKDELGNTTVVEGSIQVDVLVIRDGDRLKIKVPSIVFRPDFADFKDLPQETVDRNIEVLKRIATILNRFAGYKIRVEGHANSIAKMLGQGQAAIDKEENGELLPLSLSRATAVMQKLIEFGVDPKRLSVRGLGSSEPVVAFTDAENRWKNRRVEFILIKE